MAVIDYITQKIGGLSDELTDLIDSLENIAHSPYETSFVAGRIKELSEQIFKLKMDTIKIKEANQ